MIFAFWLAASKHGRIPLGTDDEKPESLPVVSVMICCVCRHIWAYADIP